jgi:glycerophosphoryl diester phosphodiesterase
VRLAEKHRILDRLLFIGRAIAEPQVRVRLGQASGDAHAGAVANDEGEFSSALEAPDADWVYFRYLPSKDQMEAVHASGKRAFIAGPTVSGNVPENWRHACEVGIDGILTDYPLDLRAMLRPPHDN